MWFQAWVSVAQQFQASFYRGFMELEDPDPNAQIVRQFVARMLALTG